MVGGWIRDFVMKRIIGPLLLSDYIGSAVRGLLKVLSGYLLVILPESETVGEWVGQTEALLIALIPVVIGQILSWIAKSR